MQPFKNITNGQKRFSLSVINTSVVPLTVELFNAINSFLEVFNNDYPVPNFSYTPQGEYLDLSAAPKGCGWLSNGSAAIVSNTGFAGGFVEISWITFPYKSLVYWLRNNRLVIKKIIFQGNNINNLNIILTPFQTAINGNKQQQDPVTISDWYSPQQVQNDIIIVEKKIEVGTENGLYFTLNAGASFKMTFEYE